MIEEMQFELEDFNIIRKKKRTITKEQPKKISNFPWDMGYIRKTVNPYNIYREPYNQPVTYGDPPNRGWSYIVTGKDSPTNFYKRKKPKSYTSGNYTSYTSRTR